jgi:hypothetical protein
MADRVPLDAALVQVKNEQAQGRKRLRQDRLAAIVAGLEPASSGAGLLDGRGEAPLHIKGPLADF